MKFTLVLYEFVLIDRIWLGGVCITDFLLTARWAFVNTLMMSCEKDWITISLWLQHFQIRWILNSVAFKHKVPGSYIGLYSLWYLCMCCIVYSLNLKGSSFFEITCALLFGYLFHSTDEAPLSIIEILLLIYSLSHCVCLQSIIWGYWLSADN